MPEKRIDPEDGVAYTWYEISAHYERKYKKNAIEAYWDKCKPAKSKQGWKDAEWADPKANGTAKAKKGEKKCPHCKRTFNKESAERHIKICKKVFQGKAEPFDTVGQRLSGLQDDDLVERARTMSRDRANSGPTSPMSPDSPKSDISVPAVFTEWKKKSLSTREAILAAKAEKGDKNAANKLRIVQKVLEGERKIIGPDETQQCPTCQRTFLKEVAQKHIKNCKKVFKERRESFDSQSQRLASLGGTGSSPGHSPGGRERSDSDWKNMSLSSREAILKARAANGDKDAAKKLKALRKNNSTGSADRGGTSKAREPKKAFKVCVCGGSGGIGQPLSMLMAMDSNVKELSVFDLNVAMVPPAGVAADLSHIERKAAVKGYQMTVGNNPIDHLGECLQGCSLVLVPAGMPRKPGMSRDDLFKVNADIAKGIVEACAKHCPDAMLALIVNPVNSIVPAMAELYKKKGLDPMKIVGVTTLDCVRSNKFVSGITGKDPKLINVPVIGGHAGITILPLFSQDKVAASIDASKIPDLDKHVQDAGTDVVNAKDGKGSATLSMAYAGARLGRSILAGLAGRKRTECAYVKSEVTALPYFTSKVVFGENGIFKVQPVGELNEYEIKRLEEVTTQLQTEIETGMKYAEANSLAA